MGGFFLLRTNILFKLDKYYKKSLTLLENTELLKIFVALFRKNAQIFSELRTEIIQCHAEIHFKSSVFTLQGPQQLFCSVSGVGSALYLLALDQPGALGLVFVVSWTVSQITGRTR